MLQLNPPLPVVTPKGRGFAHFVIDYGQEHDLVWVVFLSETGECWSFLNKNIRLEQNHTMETKADPDFHTSDTSFRIGPPVRGRNKHWDSVKTD